MESDFFDSVIGEFGIHQSLCYFVAANLSNELVEIDARLGGDGSTDGTVVATTRKVDGWANISSGCMWICTAKG